VNYVALLLVLAGLYLIDSGVKNRAPIGFLEALIKSDNPDLAKTLAEYNGKWSTPITDVAASTGTSTGSGFGGSKGPGVGLAPQANPRNGRLGANELLGIPFAPSKRLAPQAVTALVQMNTAYKSRFGNNIFITDAYRTYVEQITTKALKGNLAATPGTSNHGLGLALDLGGGINSFGTAQHKWMDENAAKYGWVNPSWAQQGGSKPEPWHYEFVGASGGKAL
jgi:hypothetical protein